MCKEMPVIPVNRVVDPRIIRKNNKKKWRAKEKERHKGSLTPPHTHTQKKKTFLET
jgi:hypothetical protein